MKPALKFGLFFVAILLLVEVSTAWLGDQGSLLASVIAGAASTSAVALSIAELLNEGSLAPRVATRCSPLLDLALDLALAGDHGHGVEEAVNLCGRRLV